MMNNHNHNHYQRQCVIPDLQAALRAIPQHEKVEWLHVLRVSPHLVETESDPIMFLRYSEWNVTAAARRLIMYWRKRVEVFGETRAFLPVLNDFSGNGALGSEEIEILKSGAYCVMPNDVHSRSVAFADARLMPSKYKENIDVRLRAAFYVYQQMALNPTSQTSGAVVLITGLQADGNSVAKRGMGIIREALPVRISTIQFVYLRQESTSLMQSIVPYLLDCYGRFFFNKAVVHNCESAQEVAEKLARHGLTRDSLPRSLGGFAATGIPSSGAYSSLHSSSTIGQMARAMMTDAVNNQQPQMSEWKPLFDTATPFQLPDAPDASAGDGDHYPPLKLGVAAHRGSQQLQSDPTSIQSPPRQQLASEDAKENNLDRWESLGNHSFFEMLDDMTPLEEETEGSPFEPRPIRPPSPTQYQQQASSSNGDAVTAAGASVTGADKERSHLDTTLALRSPPQERQSASPGSSATSAANDDASLRVNADIVETPEMLQLGLAALNEAMDGLPSDQHSAYKEAVRRAPNLVKSETDPLAYLRFSKFDAWAAAQRLATYWRYRVQYFGDTAFLPLTQTRGGALWEEDLQTLSTGAFFFLPTTSSRSKPIFCFDPAKCPADASQASGVRVAMYFFSILCCEHPVAVTEDGFLIFVFVSSQISGLSRFDKNVREVTDIALDSCPAKMCEMHVVFSPHPTTTADPERSFVRLVLPALLRTLGRLLIHDTTHFHVGYSRDELEHRLTAAGLSGPSLEAAMNGGISDRDFAQWLQNRQVLELRRYGQPQQPTPGTGTQGTFAQAAGGDMEATLEPRIASPAGPHDVDSAMALVPAIDKKAYREALRQAPDLVKKESNPDLFLRSENYDPLAAARRLAAYWRIRVEVFGERAFLPMDQTNDGALDRKDVAVLQTSSFLTQLPNDSEGCAVICCDGTRLAKSSSHLSQLRVFFYLWNLAAQNNLSQTTGYNVLYAMMEDTSFDRACRNCLDLIMEAQPVRLKCFHLLGCCPDGTSESDFRLHGSVRGMLKLLDPSVQEKVVVHVCESRAGFASKLGAHGMTKDGIPKSFGGKWGLEDFVLWQELRMRQEWDLPIKTSLHEVAESYSIPASVPPPPSSLLSLSQEEKTERQRRMNAIHAKRKKDRFRLEFQALQEEHSGLCQERKELCGEGRRLEELVQRAKAIVDSMNERET